jgi:hypothetical protein
MSLFNVELTERLDRINSNFKAAKFDRVSIVQYKVFDREIEELNMN